MSWSDMANKREIRGYIRKEVKNQDGAIRYHLLEEAKTS